MLCPGFLDPNYLIFIDDVPPLLYYSHIPAMIISFLLGLYIFYKDKYSLISKILLALSVTFSIWAFFNLMTWTNNDSDIIMFVWSLLGILYALIYILSLYFVYVFVDKKDISLFKKILFLLILFPLIILTPTKYNLEVFNVDACGIYNEGRYFTSYYYSVGIMIFFWILVVAISRYRKATKEFKKQIILLTLGIGLFLLSFVVSEFLASYLVDNGFVNDYSLQQYGLFGMIIFMGFLGYLIVRYQAFNIKVFGAQALVIALVALIASEYFFVENDTNKILVGITLILALGFGYILVKSVKRDIKQKEKLEILSKKLVEANVQLKKLDKAKTEFISIASHQLRTPLTAIKGYLSLVVEGSYGKISKSIRETLEKTYNANERLILLVEDLLNVSRIESGRMKYDLADVQLEDLVKQSYDSLILKAKGENLFLKINPPKNTLPAFHVDGGKVREVISNFIDNAIKYTEKGGVEVGFESDSESVKIIVSDTGIGVPEDEIPYLFKKFSRGKDTSRLNATGTGLGLFVAKNIIVAHGGKVWVESDGAGKGSRFYIQLPLKWIDPNTNAEVGMKEGE